MSGRVVDLVSHRHTCVAVRHKMVALTGQS